MALLKVATTQFNTGNDVQQNLDKFLGYIDQAAEGGARLVVGPEFGNHTSFYRDRDHAWNVAVEADGDYVRAIRQRAQEKSIFVVFNATCRDAGALYIRNFLVGDSGEMIGTDDKQVLMGGESIHLSSSTHPGRVFDTTIGRIAMMSCLDGVPPETARNLALQGAQLITNSHNSCALDEPYLHIPVRAAENRVWIMAAGKVGYICVEDMVGPLTADVGIPQHLLIALGENPILNPHGVEVSKLPSGSEGIVFADVDLDDARDKRWRDGDLFAGAPRDTRKRPGTPIPGRCHQRALRPPIRGKLQQGPRPGSRRRG
jgi:predicted amidohydrolase